MNKQKIPVPCIILDEEQYIFNVFDHDLTNFACMSFKSQFKDEKDLDNLKIYENKGFIHICYVKPQCCDCYTHNVIKKGFINRKIYLLGIGELNVKVQRYQCKKCGKNFQVDLNGLIDKNYNVSVLLKEKIVQLFDIFSGSIHKIKEFLKKDRNTDISHQTIENILKSKENENKELCINESGYYLFDVQHVKINGIWRFRYTLFDSKFNIPIIEELHLDQKFKTTEKFLKENLKYRHVKSVTTDGHPHYKKILRKLCIKHQLCIFHTEKEINRKISQFIKENKLSQTEENKIKNEGQEIINIFNSNNLKEAKNKLNNLIKRKNKLHHFIKSKILSKIRDYFKHYTYFLENKNIASTSNQIENYFSKTIPQSIKKIYRTFKGIESRINIKRKRWIRRNGIAQ